MSRGVRAAVVLSLAALLVSMVLAVRRASEVRETADRMDRLRRELNETRERVARAARRVDSLSSRKRVVESAERMGFHIPSDSEVRLLPDLPPSRALPRAASDSVDRTKASTVPPGGGNASGNGRGDGSRERPS